MELDFSKCKTAKDVKEVYKKHKKDMQTIKDFEKRVYEDKLEEIENEN